jgi:CII-binding regulator of phage lambda lysogenization HflD
MSEQLKDLKEHIEVLERRFREQEEVINVLVERINKLEKRVKRNEAIYYI